MNADERKLRKMLLAGTVTRAGDKLIRKTGRRDWRGKFYLLIERLGGSAVISNDTVTATVPEDVMQRVTDPNPWRGGREPLPPEERRQTWGSTFDPDALALIKMLGEKLGKADNHIVEQAVREMAEREKLV